ncbi:NAD(P)-binding protein [Mollisia scopiformis]|uniref:NAD(P)-binding protein n=1 Tax=Mollisia scopiformis TaxID=149040 RepID=A0A194XH30_MOLSC|nr:NAD(P)-binding protein [Mollisia scopiformis]KUJ19434.1 NAD(P)-binding protein [Mollisia scopiformis]
MTELKTTIPKGSLVLVTGATSYVASHIIKQFLERGYKVRSTVRNISDASWVATEAFKSYADTGDFELVEVADFGAEHAFDGAVKRVSAIVHVATVIGFSPDPNEVIPLTVAVATSIMLAALKEPSVKQFVYTSSCAAAAYPESEKIHVDQDSWNEKAVELAWTPPPYGPFQGFVVYFASKVAAEKAVWKIVEEKKPHFTTNVVSPGTVLGEPIHPNYVRSTGSWVPQLFRGETANLGLPATIVVDVKDIALVHVAAVLDPEVKNARLQVWGRHASWNDLLAILRKLRPQHQFVVDFPDAPYLGLSTDETKVIALLKKWGNQDGWRPLRETLAENIIFEKD